MKCDHEWLGDADGVICQKCGLRMTTEEYRAFIDRYKAFLPGDVPPEETPVEETPKKRSRKPKEEK